MTLVIQILVCFVLILLGAFFSGTETGIYRLSKFRLRLGVEQNRKLYTLLAKAMDDSDGLIFSMLIGNNLVNYIATYLVTVILLGLAMSENSAQVYTTLVMAPVLFIFSEVIPKNLYYYRCDAIMPRTAPVLWFFHTLFKWSGAVKLLKIISGLTGKKLRSSTSSSRAGTRIGPAHVEQIISETHDEGLLSNMQNEMLNRLMNISNISVSSVMIDVSKTVMVNVKSDRTKLLGLLKKHHYTRYPVYSKQPSNITGFINIYEVLAAEEFENLSQFVKPVARFSGSISVSDAIDKMRDGSCKIVLVTAGYSQRAKVSGILTMKDLVEEFTGELAQW
jgi:putative hemolysin